MKRHLTIYRHIFLFHLKSMMEHRLNFALQMLYGPAYMVVLFILLSIAYNKAPLLGGWTATEGMLLFAVFHLLYMVIHFLFMKGIRHLLWSGLRTGELDLVLTKPANTQFMITATKPGIEQLTLIVILLGFLIRQVWLLQSQISLLSVVLFLVTFTAGLWIAYCVIASYATIGFYVTKAAQIIELFDKMSDYAQYPVPIFPANFQLLIFTLIPTAFFSYVPTLFLLGKGNWWLLVLSLVMVVLTGVINQVLWKYSLRYYSSASS